MTKEIWTEVLRKLRKLEAEGRFRNAKRPPVDQTKKTDEVTK